MKIFSIQGLSDDCIIKLENGKSIKFHDIKTKKIRDIAEEFIHNVENYDRDDTMVGKGFTITYAMLDNLEKKSSKRVARGWASKFSFRKH